MGLYIGFVAKKQLLVKEGSIDQVVAWGRVVLAENAVVKIGRVASLHSKVQNGLWCPPISLGARAVGFIEHETDELIAAHMNGYSQDQLRELVSKLVLERAVLLGGGS